MPYNSSDNHWAATTSMYQAECRDQQALGTVLRVLTVRGCFVADCAVRPAVWEGVPGEADDQTALLSGAHQAHQPLPWCCLVRATALGMLAWFRTGVRCCEGVGVSPGLLHLQLAVPPTVQPLLRGQDLTVLQRRLPLQSYPRGRAEADSTWPSYPIPCAVHMCLCVTISCSL